MSTDYVIYIKRKSDNKVLGKTLANQLKNIIGSEFDKLIHCEGHDSNGVKFEVSEVSEVFNQAAKKISGIYGQIMEKKLMVCVAKNKEVKNELEEDIRYLEDDIDECKWVMYSAASLNGAISTITENLFKKNKMAYEYNGKDLPDVKSKYGNGEEHSPQYVFNDDVYCEIEVC